MSVMTETKVLKNFIGGEMVASSSEKVEAVPNPATGELLAYVPISSREDLDQAAAVAKEAYKS